MPELPEVETMKRGIVSVIGSRIQRVSFARCQLKPIAVTPSRETFRRRLAGRQVQAVERLGKRILLRLEDHQTLVIEPRMTGLVLLSDPPDSEHLRVGFQLDHGETTWLWFWDRRGLGTVQLLTSDQLLSRLGPDQLGPDALTISADLLRDRLRCSRREIKVALLDQKALAGIGNLYASEILHVAGIHPQQRCNRLAKSQWARIHAAMQDVLREAIRYEGSTLSDGTYRNALNQTGSYQNHHRVYSRAGHPCPRCQGGLIVRIVQAQRSSFYCGKCQTKRP